MFLLLEQVNCVTRYKNKQIFHLAKAQQLNKQSKVCVPKLDFSTVGKGFL